MKCPACESVTLMITERKGIEIDYCPQCRGVWLDRGELDKIIEKSGDEFNSRPAQSQSQSHHYPDKKYDDDKYYKYKKKKGLLGELFDF